MLFQPINKEAKQRKAQWTPLFDPQQASEDGRKSPNVRDSFATHAVQSSRFTIVNKACP